MPRRRRSKSTPLRVFSLCLGGLAVLFGLLAVWAWLTLPDVDALKSRYPKMHYAGVGKPPTVTLEKSRPAGWVGLSGVSKAAVRAIVLSEDWAFYQHKGFDPQQIREALEESWEEGRLVRGASTITQQVAKNVFLDRDRTLVRKLKELYVAVRLEKDFRKGKILEIYLNIAEWGEGIYGINQAARHYFGKGPDALTAKEGAFLAMLLPSPKRYSQSFRNRRLTDFAQDSIDSILGKMVQARYLTPEEKAAELLQPFWFESAPANGG